MAKYVFQNGVIRYCPNAESKAVAEKPKKGNSKK